MTRIIRLSSPAICDRSAGGCGKLIRAGRLAGMSMSTYVCYKCLKTNRGEAAKDPEEDAILDQMTDEEEIP